MAGTVQFYTYGGYGMKVYVNGRMKKEISPTTQSMSGRLFCDKIHGINEGDKMKFVLTEGYWMTKEKQVLCEITATSDAFFGYLNTAEGRFVPVFGM